MVVDRQRKARIRSDYVARQKGLDNGQVDERTPEEIVAAQMELEAMRAVILENAPPVGGGPSCSTVSAT